MASYLLFLQDEQTNLGRKTKQSIQTASGAVSITPAGLSRIKRGDLLFIVGHGSTRTLARKSPASLAKFLIDNGLTNAVNIFLYSCSTGFGGAPYALELKMELVQQKILCSVVAPTGPIGSRFNVKTSAKKESYATGFIPQRTQPSWVK